MRLISGPEKQHTGNSLAYRPSGLVFRFALLLIATLLWNLYSSSIFLLLSSSPDTIRWCCCSKSVTSWILQCMAKVWCASWKVFIPKNYYVTVSNKVRMYTQECEQNLLWDFHYFYVCSIICRYLLDYGILHPTEKYYPLRPEFAESTFYLYQATKGMICNNPQKSTTIT
jgi:hypothetical protein